MLRTNTVTTVHQRLRDEHAPGVGIASFRLYVASEFAEEANLRRHGGKFTDQEGLYGDGWFNFATFS
jgi:hypothetical protein